MYLSEQRTFWLPYLKPGLSPRQDSSRDSPKDSIGTFAQLGNCRGTAQISITIAPFVNYIRYYGHTSRRQTVKGDSKHNIGAIIVAEANGSSSSKAVNLNPDLASLAGAGKARMDGATQILPYRGNKSGYRLADTAANFRDVE